MSMRVTGMASGKSRGQDYDVYLLQGDEHAYTAVVRQHDLRVYYSRTGSLLADSHHTGEARAAIAGHNLETAIMMSAQDEEGRWHARVVLGPGVAASGTGDTQQEAIEDCQEEISILVRELKIPVPEGEPGHQPAIRELLAGQGIRTAGVPGIRPAVRLAYHGVITHLTAVSGERIAAIVPESVIEVLRAYEEPEAESGRGGTGYKERETGL